MTTDNFGLSLIRQLYVKDNIKLFLDYGTLLKHIRDKSPISSTFDDDIDISLFEPTASELESICKTFVDNKYVPQIISRYGMPVMIKFINQHGELPIDLHIYRKNSCNVAFFPLFHYVPNGFFNRLVNKLHFAHIYSKRKGVSNAPFDIDERNIFGSSVYSVKYTCLSSGLISDIVLENDLPVPRMFNEVLTSHYGNWKTPKDKWNFWLDQCDLYDLIDEYKI
jgi:hypothetical protein